MSQTAVATANSTHSEPVDGFDSLNPAAVDAEIHDLIERLEKRGQRPSVARVVSKATAKTARNPWFLALVLVLLCSVMTGLNLREAGVLPGLGVGNAAGSDRAMAERLTRFAVERIERFVDSHGKPPGSLRAIGLSAADGVKLFAIDDGGYRVVVTQGEFVIQYDPNNGFQEVGK